MDEMITIKKSEYINMRKRILRLQALENAGVDNWEGFEYVIDIYFELLKAEGLED